MSFRAALDRHLKAIRERDLDALADTVVPEELVLITSEGKLVQSTREFLELHLDYRKEPPGKAPTYRESYLTLVFQEREGRWLMVQDQNTPIR